MFDNWIELGILAHAYELNIPECFELAKHIKTKWGPILQGKIQHVDDIEDYAQRMTTFLVKQRKTKNIHAIIKYINSVWWLGPLPEFDITGNQDVDQTLLCPIIRTYCVLDLYVDKEQAVSFLYDHDYLLKNEQKGLTLKTVQKVVDRLAGLANPEKEDQAKSKEYPDLKWYGLIAVVEQCRNEGKSPQETAECLKKMVLLCQ